MLGIPLPRRLIALLFRGECVQSLSAGPWLEPAREEALILGRRRPDSTNSCCGPATIDAAVLDMNLNGNNIMSWRRRLSRVVCRLFTLPATAVPICETVTATGPS